MPWIMSTGCACNFIIYIMVITYRVTSLDFEKKNADTYVSFKTISSYNAFFFPLYTVKSKLSTYLSLL